MPKRKSMYSVTWRNSSGKRDRQHFDNPKDARLFSNLLEGRGRNPRVSHIQDRRKKR